MRHCYALLHRPFVFVLLFCLLCATWLYLNKSDKIKLGESVRFKKLTAELEMTSGRLEERKTWKKNFHRAIRKNRECYGQLDISSPDIWRVKFIAFLGPIKIAAQNLCLNQSDNLAQIQCGQKRFSL